MSSLFSRDFPPLPSQSSSVPDFTKLKQGVDYIVTYTSSGEETWVLKMDIQNLTVQVNHQNQDQTFLPPLTHSGTRYSLTTYPIKRRNDPNNHGNRAPIQGGPHGGANNMGFRGDNNNYRGGFFKQNCDSQQSRAHQSLSYSQAVTSPPQNNNFQIPIMSSPLPQGIYYLPRSDMGNPQFGCE